MALSLSGQFPHLFLVFPHDLLQVSHYVAQLVGLVVADHVLQQEVGKVALVGQQLRVGSLGQNPMHLESSLRNFLGVCNVVSVPIEIGPPPSYT